MAIYFCIKFSGIQARSQMLLPRLWTGVSPELHLFPKPQPAEALPEAYTFLPVISGDREKRARHWLLEPPNPEQMRADR